MSERPRALPLMVVTFIILGSLLAFVLSYQRFGSGSTTSITTQALTSPGYRWLRGADLPTPRAEAAAVLVGNEAYIIGGVGAKGISFAKGEGYHTTSHSLGKASPPPLAFNHARRACCYRKN